MRPSPRVRCSDCAFEWFGATSSHGLRIVGACPRCGGPLDFLDTEQEEGPDVVAHVDVDRTPDARSPAAVLGTPTSWGR